MKKNFIMFLLVFVAVIITLFIFINSLGEDKTKNQDGQILQYSGEWTKIVLKDTSSQEEFRVDDFIGKKVLLETFAVWCPTCTGEQEEIKKLNEDEAFKDSVVLVSIDTDPNENEEIVSNYVEEKGFNWRHTVAPKEFTQSLIGQFGNGIINAPTVPMVLICEDGKVRRLSDGIKPFNELKDEISKGC